MKKIIVSLLIAGAFGLGYRYYFLASPCEKPIRYSVGVIDPRHNLSQNEFISLLRGAEEVWEKPTGLDLFAYEANAKLMVNLIFDERQAEKDALLEEMAQLDSAAAEIAKREQKIETIRKEYEAKKETFEDRLAAWNKGSRRNREEFSAVKQEEINLESLHAYLKKEISNFNELAYAYNQEVRQFNHQAPGEKTAGEAKSQGEINIYLLENDQGDKYLLAHEMGHALGIEHATTSNSLMYYRLPQSIKELSREDLRLLSDICEVTF